MTKLTARLIALVIVLVIALSVSANQVAPFFQAQEFTDRITGEHGTKISFIEKLSELRQACGFPFIINSGYRTSGHPIEKIKKIPGTHTQGIAADIRVTNAIQRGCIINHALKLGFNGIGVHKYFVHIDMRIGPPVIWAY